MLCLLRSRAAKRGLAAVWFACISAGLLATSAPYEEWDGANNAIEFERSGPSVRLSDTESARSFRVTVPVPHPEGESWAAPWQATVFFEFLLEQIPDTATPEGSAPWVSVDLRDAGERSISASGPFLNNWSSRVPLTFTGDCTAGEDCRLEFLVSIQRQPIDDAESSTVVDWHMVFGVSSGRENDDADAWSVEVEPL